LHLKTLIVYFAGKVISPHSQQGGAVKSSIIRALLTLTATGAVVATTTATTPSQPGRTPLSVDATCGPNFETPQTCVAEATGGSGTGYTFTWETGTKVTTQGATSTAKVNCPENSGYRYEMVGVTDSNNDYTFTQVQLWCSPW
jgi:hypothetical protein